MAGIRIHFPALTDRGAVAPFARTTQHEHKQAGFLTRILHSQPLPILNGQWDDAEMICGLTQRIHTAARPSRIFTVFPFGYPAEKSRLNLNMPYQLSKNAKEDSKVYILMQEDFVGNPRKAELSYKEIKGLLFSFL